MRRPPPFFGLFVLACAMLVVVTDAGAAENDEGRVLARTWCANCHVIDGGASATDAAPPFREIVASADLRRERLRAWLSTPHDRMPNLGLGRQEIEALIDYLQSSKP